MVKRKNHMKDLKINNNNCYKTYVVPGTLNWWRKEIT